MEIISEQRLKLPLPLYAKVLIGSAITEEKIPFAVYAGLDENLASQLRKYSADMNDTEIQNNTSDHERFVEGSYEEWFKKGRVPIALVNMKTDTLAAIAWFGVRDFPALKEGVRPETKEAWHTFAIRTYGPYRGKRLAFPFSEYCISEYRALFPNPMWLSTPPSNTGARKLYAKLGFTEVGAEEDGEVVMVKA